MRPSSVTQTIHDHGLTARAAELSVIRRTLRASTCDAPVRATVQAEHDGFVTGIDLDAIATALHGGGDTEVTLLVTRGSHVAFNQRVAAIRAAGDQHADDVAQAVRRAVTLDRTRDLGVDPSLAVTELSNIAWSAISSAKHNPQTGREAVDRLRDLLARWSHEDDGPGTAPDGEPPNVLPVVYEDSDVDHLIDSLLSLVVACLEAMQPDTCAYVLEAVAGSLPELSPRALEGAEQALLSTLSAVRDQTLTARWCELFPAFTTPSRRATPARPPTRSLACSPRNAAGSAPGRPAAPPTRRPGRPPHGVLDPRRRTAGR